MVAVHDVSNPARASGQFYRFQPRGVARYPQLTSTRGIP